MTPLEIALMFAIAALIYHEVSWRDRVRQIESDYEKRLSTEVAMAYERGSGGEAGRIRAFTFQARKEEPRGLFREVTRHLFIAITMDGNVVTYAAGDLNEIDRFHIPPQIKSAVLEFMAAAPRMAVA